MSKTHKITQLKKRIAELEKKLNAKYSLATQAMMSQRRDIVTIGNTTQYEVGRFRELPSEEEILRRAISEMFDVYAHPEVMQLFTCTVYVVRSSPMMPDSDILAYDVKCDIVKPSDHGINRLKLLDDEEEQ